MNLLLKNCILCNIASCWNDVSHLDWKSEINLIWFNKQFKFLRCVLNTVCMLYCVQNMNNIRLCRLLIIHNEMQVVEGRRHTAAERFLFRRQRKYCWVALGRRRREQKCIPTNKSQAKSNYVPLIFQTTCIQTETLRENIPRLLFHILFSVNVLSF